MLTTFGQRPPLVTPLQTCHGSPSSLHELLGKCSDALHEAFAAYRAYHRLTSNRIPHDAALRKAFGLDEARECQRTEQQDLMDHRECIDKAILNPEGRFRHLMDVIAAVDVTAREKLANLKVWEADERAPQRAESEGHGRRRAFPPS